jgi:hypothetical protein
VASELLHLMCAECNRTLDPAEFRSMIDLILLRSNESRNYAEGICYDILDRSCHPSLRPLIYANCCYYNVSRDMNMPMYVNPSTIGEFMLLSNTSNMRGLYD